MAPIGPVATRAEGFSPVAETELLNATILDAKKRVSTCASGSNTVESVGSGTFLKHGLNGKRTATRSLQKIAMLRFVLDN